jgi:hypothetical protein
MAENARKTKGCSWDEWDPLTHVIVGRSDGTMIADDLPEAGTAESLYSITFLPTERGILHKPVLYLSHYFKPHRVPRIVV